MQVKGFSLMLARAFAVARLLLSHPAQRTRPQAGVICLDYQTTGAAVNR